LSIDGAAALLDGWSLERPARCRAPVGLAADILTQFGVEVTSHNGGDPSALRIRRCRGRAVDVGVIGWRGEAAAVPCRPPNGDVLTAYAGLRLAGAAVVAARRGIDRRLGATHLHAELTAPTRIAGGIRPELLRCRDGWAVVRWREESERELLRALAGPDGDLTRDELVGRARLARMLVAPVAPPPDGPVGVELARGAAIGPGRQPCARARVIDWSVLWAGPYATCQLRRSGAVVQRVEHPRRRDGLLSYPGGRRWWRSLNGSKRTTLLDARRDGDRRRLQAAIADAELLVTSMTPRALDSLGFGDSWRQEHAPHVMHIELVAFEDPWSDAPGLGEHATAQAGLLWRAGLRPAQPLPWADSLLGAATLVYAQAWLASEHRPGGRVRLSLERAASLAFAADRAV
jgi:hypothetical protein